MLHKISKGRVLSTLSSKLDKFIIPKCILINVGDWVNNQQHQIKSIEKEFDGKILVVRSSASDEDGALNSLAGEYDSVLNVPSDNRNAVVSAVEKVITSYAKKKDNIDSEEILIQEMVLNVSMSGVVFTHELNTGAPYYVINYDDVSGLTNTVTAGDGEYANRTLYIHRGAAKSQLVRSIRFQRLIEAIMDLESEISNQFLDIEFALDENFQPYLLQVREITTQSNWNRAITQSIDSELKEIHNLIHDRFKPSYNVHGQTTVFGQMPDWNPVEMIGRTPGKLAFSLYSKLITDKSWSKAREEMGYMTPGPQPLMLAFGGQPYIDTRLSFHSYLPQGLPTKIAEKIVNNCIKRLKENPHLHDKIEFDIAITAFSFDIDKKIDLLFGDVLDTKEKKIFRKLATSQTFSLITSNTEGSINDALSKIEKLSSTKLPSSDEDPNALFSLLEDCINYGIVPFSILARHGFIAKGVLMSLVECNVFSLKDVDNFLLSIKTVAGEMLDDMIDVQNGNKTYEIFMERYGHLRPGTYDLMSLRYDQIPDFYEYIMKSTLLKKESDVVDFKLDKSKKLLIQNLLSNEKINNVSPEKLLDYCKKAIGGREYGKFIFTRSISSILELIANFGKTHNLSREEMSHVSINHVLEILTSSSTQSIEERLRNYSRVEEKRHSFTSAIRLPQILFDQDGVYVVPFQISQPNFITSKKVTAKVVHLDTYSSNANLKDKIVLIENADPGYDWIFAQQISGLVTKYGGANSHMAIRCSEFSIPAAIGCGEQQFEKIVSMSRISLDCTSGVIAVVH